MNNKINPFNTDLKVHKNNKIMYNNKKMKMTHKER